MLSGLKFIPREQIDKVHDEKSSDSDTRKGHKKKKKSRHSEDGSERIKKRSKKKWYSSEETSSSSSESDSDTRMRRRRKGKSKKSRSKEYSSDDENNVADEKKDSNLGTDMDGVSPSANYENIVRKEMGLEWMLRPKDDAGRKLASPSSDLLQETPTKEIKKANPRELNPYLNNDGSGYPEEEEKEKESNLLSTSVVGDGGASWRLKALKRAQEQAAREGKNLDEVVGERWGSLGKLAVSVASGSAAPSHAHHHAIRNRIRLQNGDQQNDNGGDKKKGSPHGSHTKMRMPRPDGSLSWGKQKSQSMSVTDAGVISSALSSMQKFTNDGSFLQQFKSQQQQQNDDSCAEHNRNATPDVLKPQESSSSMTEIKPALSENQLAAQVMKLRMKGKHDEADKLLKEAVVHKSKADTATRTNLEGDGTASRYIMHGLKTREKMKEEDADMHVARAIMQNKKYSISGQADDEYDYDDGLKRKKRGKGADVVPKTTGNTRFEKRILTQKECCNFCFENPKRPRHLVVAIANFTYLMLPPWQPVVPGHCCILPMQHELATRSVDDNVWDEIRNFKKCLLMMFAKQEKEVVFLETVMGLAKQSRHCMIECIPLPPDVGKQAPVYFKKAIDEAESEWSQHNAKKLIDTSERGLRHSIPEDFPYFHVEFGLKKGFVHVIDDESQFKSSFGVNVVRGMLRLPAEDMHRRHKYESVDAQKEAVAKFTRDWEAFDWTKQLD